MYDWTFDDEVPEQDHREGEQPAVLLRMEHAAARLGVHRTMMYKLVQTGEVESVQIGRLRRIPVTCLDEYVDRLRARADAVHR